MYVGEWLGNFWRSGYRKLNNVRILLSGYLIVVVG